MLGSVRRELKRNILVAEADIAATQPVPARRQRKRKEAIGIGHGAKTRSLVKNGSINQRFSALILYETAYRIGSYGNLFFMLRFIGNRRFLRSLAQFQQHIRALLFEADASIVKQCLQCFISRKMLQRRAIVNFVQW